MDPKKAQHLYSIKWTQEINKLSQEMEELFESAIEMQMQRTGLDEARSEIARIMAL